MAELTAQDRWNATIKDIRKAGVKVRQNVQSCCRGCAEPFKGTKSFDADTTPYAWTYGGQGCGITWIKGEPHFRSELGKTRRGWSRPKSEADMVFFNHGNGSTDKVVDAFRAHGFEVEWDGSEWSTVIVKF